MSSAYHDEALRKTRSLERKAKQKGSNQDGITVQESQAPVFKCVPEVDYLKMIEDENKKKCQKRSVCNIVLQQPIYITDWVNHETFISDFRFLYSTCPLY